MASQSERFERLAQIVAAAESDGTSVVDTSTDIYAGALHATIEVKIEEGPQADVDPSDLFEHDSDSVAFVAEGTYSGETVSSEWSTTGDTSIESDLEDADVDADEIVDELAGDFEDDATGEPADAAATTEAADQAAVDVPTESDVAPADLEDGAGDTADEDQSVVGEREDGDGVDEEIVDAAEDATDEEADDAQDDDALQEALDEAGVEADDEPPEGSLAAEVLTALREEGECSGPDLKDGTGSRSEIYAAISELEEADLIAKRDDPDDGRRTLYRPAEMDVEDGDGEEVESDQTDAADDEPQSYEGPEPAEVLDRHVDAAITAGDVLSACGGAGTVSEVAAELGVASADLEPVLWEFGLKQQGNRLLVEDVDERVEEIRQEVEP